MKNIIKTIGRRLGVKILKIDTPMRSLDMGLEKLSRIITPSHVIDVGVDYGSPELYATFPPTKHKYILIEADPANAERLKKIEQSLGHGARSANVFCGPEEGSVTLYTYDNHAYSTAYKSDYLSDHKPVQVPVKTLDSIVQPEIDSGASFLLKIDVEGAEMDVLRGATETLKKCVAVVTELSVSRKYEGGAELGDVVSYLRDQGFSVYDLCSGFDRDDKLYQLDAIFVRTDADFR
ncbi:FkbM family methyltransferase [Candidatus Kaiserbacteria bacterium]|nr:FkbM family methyltransferase [Candidatus Kaiserbacteria bacterium]